MHGELYHAAREAHHLDEYGTAIPNLPTTYIYIDRRGL